MSNKFEFTDEELDVLAFTLWERDNSLAMLPPGQFTEQDRDVRVVAKLAHEFEQRNREAQVLREAELVDKIMKVAYDDDGGLPDLNRVVREIIKTVRAHDNPSEPEAPKPGPQQSNDFGDSWF